MSLKLHVPVGFLGLVINGRFILTHWFQMLLMLLSVTSATMVVNGILLGVRQPAMITLFILRVLERVGLTGELHTHQHVPELNGRVLIVDICFGFISAVGDNKTRMYKRLYLEKY